MNNKGQIAWNKGLKTGIIPRSAFKKGEHPSSKTEFKKGVSASPSTQFKKGFVPWNKDKHYELSDEAKENIRLAVKKQWADGERKMPQGLTNKGNTHSIEVRKKMREN